MTGRSLMLSKPPFLKEEVKTFENFIVDCYIEYHDDDFSDLDLDELRMIDGLNFYTQPFKVGMVFKYFKMNVGLNIAKYKFPFPRTLQEFISDCDRIGIKLIWKE